MGGRRKVPRVVEDADPYGRGAVLRPPQSIVFLTEIRYNILEQVTRGCGMILQYYITKADTGERVDIEIDAATAQDLEATKQGWQTTWDTAFILDLKKEKYVAKTDDGEIVALGAYRVQGASVTVYIAYIESQPESNPTLTEHRKYSGIGKAMIAFGIQLSIDADCNGVVVFEAKTDDLEQHYIRDFGARRVASLHPGGANTYMIADEAAKDIFSSYLF